MNSRRTQALTLGPDNSARNDQGGGVWWFIVLIQPNGFGFYIQEKNIMGYAVTDTGV